MKKIIIIILLFSAPQFNAFSQSKFIESDSLIRNYTDYFKNLDKNFKWNFFAFDSNYSNYVDDLESLTEQEEQWFISKYNTKINDSNVVYRFNSTSDFSNLPFDNTYIRFGVDSKSQFYEELIFNRKIEDSNKVIIDYKEYLEKLIEKFGQPKTWGNFSVWAGNNIYIKFLLGSDNNLELEIGKYLGKNYFKSLKFKYDYHCTSELFKEIDNSYSFRGIKFETSLDKIKQLTKLTPENEEAKFSFFTFDKKYTQWNQLIFQNETYFGFNSDRKLSEINLFWKYNNEDEFNDFQDKILNLLGSPSYENDKFRYWHGNKIYIVLDKEISESMEGLSLISLNSNFIKTKKDKYY